jgi:hypothetical protein
VHKGINRALRSRTNGQQRIKVLLGGGIRPMEIAEIVPIYPPINSLPAKGLTPPAFTTTMPDTTTPRLGGLSARIR